LDETVTGLVLCGGRARRLGGVDKGLYQVAGKPLVEYVMARLRPQVDSIMISANRNMDRYGCYEYPVIGDDHADFRGPLAGVLAGLKVCRTEWLVTAPCDAPLLPEDLVSRLMLAAAGDAEVACAFDGERLQPVFAAFHRSVAPALGQYLDSGEAKIDRFLESRAFVRVAFEAGEQTFMNLNSPEDVEWFESVVAGS
jgi:molybdenum cofactor guanylyltransferase